MNAELQNHLAEFLNGSIKQIRPLSGGDISRAYKVTTQRERFFIKLNKGKRSLDMFQAERLGLQAIKDTQTIHTPLVIACDTFEGTTFLIMEFIESKHPSEEDFKTLGQSLAKLHQVTNPCFGWPQDNYIGSLFQTNTTQASWLDFYTKQRLIPQLELARQSGLLKPRECPSENLISDRLGEFFDNIQPSLLHGDLWGGNYLVTTNGSAYVIDPAVYYGHHEMDIAMSKLFGGFGTNFYDSYNSIFPPDPKTGPRMELYQLYYLLVHLNLFGTSYYSSVISILKKYFF